MNKYLKFTLIFWGIIFFVIIAVYGLILLSFSLLFNDDTFSSKKELIENYELKQKEINDLCIYVKNITNNSENLVVIENDKTLKTKLKAANCISVASGEPITINFKSHGIGMYSYKIFDKPLTDSLINQYNDGCQYIFYKDNVVLEYGGGVFGQQCFETE